MRQEAFIALQLVVLFLLVFDAMHLWVAIFLNVYIFVVSTASEFNWLERPRNLQ